MAVKMNKSARALLLAIFTAVSGRAGEPISILPSDTDPRISEFNSPHLAWLPEGSARNRLLVFLPGTGGTPEKGAFHAFAATAAGVGYHVVALMYPDNIAEQSRCGQSPDPGCDLRFQNAIIRGGAIGPRRIISPQDSIESRIEKVLVYLDARQAGRGWGQYLEPRRGVRWRMVAVAGQSQGGGHSYLLGKNHEVDRVLMFGSPKDYSFHFDAPAKGFDANTRTPLKPRARQRERLQP
jgi:hypothetical protein